MEDWKALSSVGVGYRSGMLTVVEPTRQRRNGYVVWRCRCDCGGEILLDTRYLQRGAVRDCGCGGGWRARTNLAGKRFGKLVCLEPIHEKVKGRTLWRCRCDCGNECVAVSTQLTHGYKKSCGCLHGPRSDEFLGKRFGALTVMSYAGKSGGKHLWNCRCDCGGETVVSQSNLRNGHTKSCGCLQREIHRQNLKIVDGTSVVMIENRMKQPIKSNTSGVSGVYYNNKLNQWSAQITFKGKTYYLGSFDDLEDARRARKRGEEMYDDFLEWYYSEYVGEGKSTEMK